MLKCVDSNQRSHYRLGMTKQVARSLIAKWRDSKSDVITKRIGQATDVLSEKCLDEVGEIYYAKPSRRNPSQVVTDCPDCEGGALTKACRTCRGTSQVVRDFKTWAVL